MTAMSGNKRTTFGVKQAKALLDSNPRLNEYVGRHFDVWQWFYDAVDAAVERWRNKPQVGDSKPGIGPVVYRPRDHFRKDGKAKVAMDQPEAEALALTLNIRAYQCWVCGFWHVGHRTAVAA